MQPASSATTGAASTPVGQMTPNQLKSLRQDSQKLTVYHQTSAKALDRQVILEGVAAAMPSAFSPPCKALLGPNNVGTKSITIIGGSASACKEIIKYMNKYCDDKRSVPIVPHGSQLLGYFQLHEAAEVMSVEIVADWAMFGAELVLEEPVSEQDVTAVLSKYTTGRYQCLLRYNLAYCMSAWLGGYSEDCQFIKDLEEHHAEFVGQLRLTCEAFNIERRDACARRLKALFAEDERVRAEEERKGKQVEKRQAKQRQRKARCQTVSHQVAEPIPEISPSPAGSYAAVAAGPVQAPPARAATATAPAPKPTNQSVNRARTQIVAHASPSAAKTVPTRAVAAPANTWASIARQGAQRAAQ